MEWLYTSLQSAAMPTTCVSYQLWLHPTPGTTAHEGHSLSTPGVQASFCLASGPQACHFMWYDAPKCHDGQVPGITKFVFGEDSSHGNQGGSSTPCASPAKKDTAVSLSGGACMLVRAAGCLLMSFVLPRAGDATCRKQLAICYPYCRQTL